MKQSSSLSVGKWCLELNIRQEMRRYLVQKTMAANLPHIVRQVGSRKRHALLGCQVALLSLGLLAANSNSENIVERTRKALALRKELLTQYSV